MVEEQKNNSGGMLGLNAGEVVSLVAHELKNPLASIKGYAELLVTGAVGPVNPEQSRFLHTVLINVERMSELIADLSDASQLEDGQMGFKSSTFALNELVQDVMRLLLPQMDEKGLVVCTEIPGRLPMIYADRARVLQVVINLVSNAAKYTPPGGKITLTAKVINENSDQPCIDIAVSDTGIGIATEDQQYIFSRYYRASDAREQEIPGTGLGLYISKRLVERMNGSIRFESNLNLGSTFAIMLPCA
jgi:signal transduction histidine kinase